MKKVLIVVLTIFSFNSFSQSQNWENITEIEGVKIDKTIIECGVNELLTFRFINLNDYDVSVSFYEEVWIDGVCKQDGASQEYFRVISLKSNEIISGSCSFTSSFYIGNKIKRGTKTMVLTNFDLKNISVIIEK
jgi:hypothetical protein